MEIHQISQEIPRKSSTTTSQRRSVANAEHRLAEQRWELEHEEPFDRRSFLERVLPGLASITTTKIAREIGVSTSAASKIRSGKRVPHPRHWAALAALAGEVGLIRPDDPGGSPCRT
jgi:hypothetical protein